MAPAPVLVGARMGVFFKKGAITSLFAYSTW